MLVPGEEWAILIDALPLLLPLFLPFIFVQWWWWCCPLVVSCRY